MPKTARRKSIEKNEGERADIDPRSPIHRDEQFQDDILKKGEIREDFIELSLDGGFCYLPPKPRSFKPILTPGVKVRFWGRGFGYPVRGCAINGQVLFYRTEAQEEARHKAYVKAEEKKREADLKKNFPKYAREIALLPEDLRRRFDRFRANNPTFDRDYGQYELFCCQQAVKIAGHFMDRGNETDRVKSLYAWARLDHAKQREAVPEMDDGHSGNTFGCSVKLAARLLSNPKAATLEHGALTSLVGCKDYGCPPITQEEASAAGLSLATKEE